MTSKQVKEVRDKLLGGKATVAELARMYGVSTRTIIEICS